MNVTKKKQTHRCREQTSGYQWGLDGRGNIGVQEWEVQTIVFKIGSRDFPGGAVVKNPPANAGDTGSSPGPGRSHMLRST